MPVEGVSGVGPNVNLLLLRSKVGVIPSTEGESVKLAITLGPFIDVSNVAVITLFVATFKAVEPRLV